MLSLVILVILLYHCVKYNCKTFGYHSTGGEAEKDPTHTRAVHSGCCGGAVLMESSSQLLFLQTPAYEPRYDVKLFGQNSYFD